MNLNEISILEAYEELNKEKEYSEFLTKCFAKRYSTNPRVSSSKIDNFSFREFQLGEKLAVLVESMTGGLTNEVLLKVGERNWMFETYLEAEVSVADYLAEE